MTKVFVCDGVPFPTFESARVFAMHYFERTGEVLAIEIDDITVPDPGPVLYQSPAVRFHQPNRQTRRQRRAAQKTAIYIQQTRRHD